jgi:membrane associated rhomboid family serine protease
MELIEILASSPGTSAVMIITAVVSIVAFTSSGLWRGLALEPYRMVRTGQYHQVVTAGLLHADFWHLFVNMLTLFFFGPWLEATVGGPVFLTIYLASLLAGNIYPLIKYRNRENYVAIGASGAVSGILFSFCLFYPTAILRLFFFIPMPAFLFAILYVVYSIYAMRGRNDNIGHEAHLAGALTGIVLTLILVPEVIESIRGLLE